MARESSTAKKPDQAVVESLFSLYREGNYAELAGRIQSLLNDHPEELVLHSLLGAAWLELGEYDSAIDSYRAALAIKPDFDKVHNSLGIAHLRLRQFDEAGTAFRNAVGINPRFAEAWFNLGIVHENSRQWSAAAECYRKAIAARPDYAEAHNSLATVLWQEGETDAVAEHYGKALSLRRNYYPAWRNLLHFLEKANRHEELKQARQQAADVLGNHELIRFYAGVLADMDNDTALARTLLESIVFDTGDNLGCHDEQLRLGRLVAVCDRLDDTAGAMDYARRANALSQAISADKGIAGEGYQVMVRERRAFFVPENLSCWSILPQSGMNEMAPVFIVGFPRSGTTLLDTILRGHPQIRIAEECDAVALLVDRLASASDHHLQNLPDLKPDTIRQLGELYRDRLNYHLQTDDESLRLIDRSTLNMIHAGEILRIFPEARFIFLLRHPADSVLSCYMQTFYETPANANFYSLEDAAALYDLVFGLWRQYEEGLGMNILYVRYEDIVEDIEQACRSVLDFIDMPWHPAMLEHRSTARNREMIRTASYNQVTQPLYTRAAGRWRRYRDALEPVLPVLEPWARRFGYSMK
ncbi:MAG: sulfotransferase [Gammaproteobacteria bacterium]